MKNPTIKSGRTLYINVEQGRAIITARVICACGYYRRFTRQSGEPSDPRYLRPYTSKCPECGEVLTASVFFFIPYEFDTLAVMGGKTKQQSVPVANAFLIRGFDIFYRIKCDNPGCSGKSELLNIAAYGPGWFPLEGTCQNCGKNLESDINFGC